MAIVFDPPAVYDARYGRTCHLLSDLGGPKGSAELLAFGKRIGMQPRWLQKAGTPDEHFDLFESRVPRAVAAGAVKVSRFRLHEVLATKRADALRSSEAKES